MSYLDLFWHLAGFLAPAFLLAPLTWLLVRVLGWRGNGRVGPLAELAIGFSVCVLVLVAGLLLTGEDGRLLTYALLALACGITQALLVRSRKR